MENNLEWDTDTSPSVEPILDPYANEIVSAPLPEKEAKKRATKIQVAFSGDETAPSFEEILADVSTQREDRLKERLATSEAIKKRQLKQNLIREVVDSGDASPDALSFLQGLSAEEIVDKEGILEKKYAEWRMNLGLSSDDSGTLEKAMEANPEGVNESVDGSVDRLYRFELAGAARARAEAKYAQTGIGRTLLDFGFGMLPWAEAQEAKNITPDNVQAEGVLPSTVRRSQIRDLFAMPPKEFEATIAQMEKEADESGDWKPFIQLTKDLEEYSQYQGQVDNAFAIVSLVELAPGGVVFDAVKGVGTLGRAGARSIAVADARKKAQEAVLGTASKGGSPTTPKAAGEAPKPVSEATATATAGPTWDNLTPTYFAGGKTLTLYRGEGKNMGPAGPTVFWTTDPKKAAQYGTVKQVEVTQEDLKSFSVGHGGPDEFVTDNPKFGAVRPPEPILNEKEVVLSAVAEKAAGDPRPIDEIATSVANDEPLFLESQLQAFEAKIADPDPATYRQTGKVVTGRYGEQYKITELTDKEMVGTRKNGRSPLGFIGYEKDPAGHYNIFINAEKISSGFKSKWWTGKDGKLPNGTRAFPADAFKTEGEFKAFVVEHEIAHISAEHTMPFSEFKEGDKLIELENQVNKAALYRIGRRDLVKKVYPEDFRSASGPDPDVSPAPPKVAELSKPKSYPTPQTIDVPGTQKKFQTLKARIKDLNEEIEKTYPKGSPTSAGVPDKGERRLSLQLQLNKAQEELRKVTSVIDSKPYQLHVKGREELAQKIKLIGDQLAFPSKHYPDLKGKEWIKKSLSLKKELKELQARWEQSDRLDLRPPKEEVTPAYVSSSDSVDEFGNRTVYSTANLPKKMSPDWRDPHIIVDVPNAKTGGSSQVQIPATDENLAQVYISNVEASGMRDMADDPAALHAAHGDLDRAAIVEALSREAKKGLFQTVAEKSKALFRKLPSIYDPTGAVVGRPNFVPNQKLANNLAEGKYKAVVERQLAVNAKLKAVFEESDSMGALRLSEDVFDAIKDLAVAQTKKEIKSPNSAILNISFRREWESTARTNEVVYHLGTPDGGAFVDLDQARVYAEDMYGLLPGNYGIRTLKPDTHILEVAKVINETDPNILNMAIQTDTKTPVSFVNTFIGFLRSPGEISSETLRQNLRVSTHHANKLHEAFVVAAQDIGKMTKKEMRQLDALMEAKRNVEKIVYDPVTNKETKVIGEWFENGADLEKVYKRAFGEYPSENVTSAYFTMRQMYDFDLLHRNLKLYSEKTRKGFKIARPYIPIPDDNGMVKWVQMKKGFEVKPLDEMPSGNVDVLILDAERAQAHYVNTAKSGVEGIKELQSRGYKLLQVAAPDQRPLKNVNNNYVNIIVSKDVEIGDLSFDQLPATAGGHIRYNENVYLKQPRYEVTENGDKLYLGDRTILGMSSDAEGAKRMADYDTGRQLLKAGDIQGLVAHLKGKIPMSVGKFEALFRPTVDNTGKIVEEPILDLDTPIVWVRDGQGTNDAAKTHAPQLLESFKGVRDTIDDPLNEMAGIGKKYTGEKDSTLQKIVDGDGIFEFQNARMISPMETLEQAWAEISRNIATDNMKIQAMTTWVEEAADALVTPLEKLRQNPWEALNNPQWNRQYGDLAKIRTLDAQRRQILNFLVQKDDLGSSLDWMRNKLLDSVFNKKGQQAADFVDDHVLPNVRNPLSFMRSFAFHTKMGFFNPIQLFLQSNTMVNTWAITGNLQRVGSALSGVTLMQMSRINRTPEILADLAKKSEKLGWRPGEWLEMDGLFHKLALHTVEGEHGTLDVMTNPKLFKGAAGIFLDKGLMFFREGERAVRANAFAVAFKEFRDKFPEKVINNIDENRIMSRAQVLMGMMNRGDNALWQKGLTGPMTQFWGYQARIMEQLLGKQLTRAEKLRLGTAFAAMYGMPVSLASATMFQIPGWSTDDLRQYAQENNININSGIGSVAMNGIPAELIRWMTSDENGQGGLLLDIGGRYGPGGLPVVKNLLEAKDGVPDALIDLAFGASGSITRDFFKQVLPDDWDIIESVTNAPRLALTDYANMFSTISTVNNGVKLYWAIKTHQNLTKDGLNLGDKSPISSFISFTTGLEEQRFKDTFLKMDSLKDLKTANDELGKEYLRAIRKAKILPQGSEERAYAVRKARALLIGMDPKDVKRLLKLGLKNSGSLEESIGKDYDEKFRNN